MAKIKLGTRPKNFTRVVTVPMLEGGTGTIQFSFIYRTRTEFGEFVDTLFTTAGVKQPEQPETDVQFRLKDLLEKTRDQNAEYIIKIADGWDLDEEFTLTNVKRLCDEIPGAAFAAIDAYRMAVSEGRLGN